MLSYRENNIIFRIASADAISKFKSIQAHSLLQVCRKELDFHPSTREILLLTYDRFSTFILRLERLFLMLDNYRIDYEFIEKIYFLINEEFKSIEEICNSHTEIFNLYGIDLLKIIHQYSLDIIFTEMKKLNKEKIDTVFVQLINLFTEYLQHLLVSIHELDNNCIKKNNLLFFGLTNFCYLGNCNNFPIITRIKFHKNIIPRLKIITIKNYTNDPISIELHNKLIDFGLSLKLEKDEEHFNYTKNMIAA